MARVAPGRAPAVETASPAWSGVGNRYLRPAAAAMAAACFASAACSHESDPAPSATTDTSSGCALTVSSAGRAPGRFAAAPRRISAYSAHSRPECPQILGREIDILLVEISSAEFALAYQSYSRCTPRAPRIAALETAFPRTLIGRLAMHAPCDASTPIQVRLLREALESGEARLAATSRTYHPFDDPAPETERTVSDSFRGRPRAGTLFAFLESAGAGGSARPPTLICLYARNGLRDRRGDLSVEYGPETAIENCAVDYLNREISNG